MTSYAKEAHPIDAKLKHLANDLKDHLEKAHFTTKEIGKCYKELQNTVNKYNDKVPFGKCPEIGLQFEQMSHSFSKWSDILMHERSAVLQHMVRPMKYQKHIWTSVTNLLNLRQTVAQDYLDGWKELDISKNKLWEKKDRKKWELDPKATSHLDSKYLDDEKTAKKLILSESTRVLKNLQNIFGHINTKLRQEFGHLMSYMSRNLCSHMNSFAEQNN